MKLTKIKKKLTSYKILLSAPTIHIPAPAHFPIIQCEVHQQGWHNEKVNLSCDSHFVIMLLDLKNLISE